MKKIAVLVVDDSALMRSFISKIINDEPDLTVVGTAFNGLVALDKISKLNPDVITLDLDMPELDGIAFLKELKKRQIDLPVIVISSYAKAGAKITMEALNLGACDFICKSSGAISLDISSISKQLIDRIYTYYAYYQRKKHKPVYVNRLSENTIPTRITKGKDWPRYVPLKRPCVPQVLCIGASTGGPFALQYFLSHIPNNFPLPILIAQHMPREFTSAFAESLNTICPLRVQEATHGAIVQPGEVYVAPGNAHMTVEKGYLVPTIRLTNDPPHNGHRPSIDVLFASVLQVFGEHAIAILLTGMGEDGAREIGRLYRQGAITIAQDRASSVVFGMPKTAIEHGYIHHIFPLTEMPNKVTLLIQQHAESIAQGH